MEPVFLLQLWHCVVFWYHHIDSWSHLCGQFRTNVYWYALIKQVQYLFRGQKFVSDLVTQWIMPKIFSDSNWCLRVSRETDDYTENYSISCLIPTNKYKFRSFHKKRTWWTNIANVQEGCIDCCAYFQELLQLPIMTVIEWVLRL